jgi:hypothetical protein
LAKCFISGRSELGGGMGGHHARSCLREDRAYRSHRCFFALCAVQAKAAQIKLLSGGRRAVRVEGDDHRFRAHQLIIAYYTIGGSSGGFATALR